MNLTNTIAQNIQIITITFARQQKKERKNEEIETEKMKKRLT